MTFEWIVICAWLTSRFITCTRHWKLLEVNKSNNKICTDSIKAYLYRNYKSSYNQIELCSDPTVQLLVQLFKTDNTTTLGSLLPVYILPRNITSQVNYITYILQDSKRHTRCSIQRSLLSHSVTLQTTISLFRTAALLRSINITKYFTEC